jgi:hypothetical protein
MTRLHHVLAIACSCAWTAFLLPGQQHASRPPAEKLVREME